MDICKSIKSDGTEAYWINKPPFLIKPSYAQLSKLRRQYPDMSIVKICNTTGKYLVQVLSPGIDKQVYLELNDSPKVIKCGHPDVIRSEAANYERLNNESQYFSKYYGTFGVTETSSCIIIEYIPGDTLDFYFGQQYTDSFETIVIEGYTALDQLHAKGIIHDDLGNPSNVIVSEKGLVIIDLESNYRFTPGVINSGITEGIYHDNMNLTWLFFEILSPIEDVEEYYELSDNVAGNEEYGRLIPYLEAEFELTDSPAIRLMIDRIKAKPVS